MDNLLVQHTPPFGQTPLAIPLLELQFITDAQYPKSPDAAVQLVKSPWTRPRTLDWAPLKKFFGLKPARIARPPIDIAAAPPAVISAVIVSIIMSARAIASVSESCFSWNLFPWIIKKITLILGSFLRALSNIHEEWFFTFHSDVEFAPIAVFQRQFVFQWRPSDDCDGLHCSIFF